MDNFVRLWQELAVEGVTVVLLLSRATADKAVNASWIRIIIDERTSSVDLLPTIRSKTHDSNNWIPMREGRGSANENRYIARQEGN